MDVFQKFAQDYAIYGYPVLFLGVLLENAGIPVPGETAVLIAGFLASPAGGSQFDIVWVVALAALAAIIGDNLGFWIGHRWARPWLLQGRRFLFLTPKTLEMAEGYFHKFGIWTIFFARFIAGLRVVGALAAGTSGMRWTHFLVANAAGAFAWSLTMSLLGYFFGHSWELLHKWIGRGGLLIAGSVVVLLGLHVLLRHLRKHAGLLEGVPGMLIWRAIFVALLEVVCIGLLVLLAEERRPVRIDREIEAALSNLRGHNPLWDMLAICGSTAGSFPVAALVSLALLAELWVRRAGRREFLAVVWAFLASEAVGLVLVTLFRFREVDVPRALAWPWGFAGLVPLRAFAVFGMAAKLLGRQHPLWGRIAGIVALVLILLAGFSVVWTGQQGLTEVLLEFAAGGLILFGGIWWLEGHGPAWQEIPPQAPDAAAPTQRP